MSQHAYTCIEQLDLAADQLRRGSPSYARFALILTDNVVELIIHRVCSNLILYDDMWVKLGEPKYSSKQRENALGQRFERKARFLVSASMISADQADFVVICHKYRNELYHAGLHHDDIVLDIAWHYHDFAISLFEKVNPNNSWYSGAEVTEAVARHAGSNGTAVISDIASVANSLRIYRPAKKRPLTEALSCSAVRHVDELIGKIEFLVDNDPQRRTEDEILYDLQFFDYLHSDDSVAKTVWGKVKTLRQRDAAIVFLQETWQAKYKAIPLPSFRAQAEKVASLKTDIFTLRAFEKFKNDIAYFGRIVDEAHIALDGYIQNQIDAAREK
jgi:hypothetical protein